MPPKAYYDVKTSAYLFGMNNEKPEEKIRQWVLFELLTSYGISINDVEIERLVRVGTRNHRADVVILIEGTPLIVIECKRWEDVDIAKGVSQAISYASSDAIRAEYAVYTNGQKWLVKRQVAGSWVSVPDIPRCLAGSFTIDLGEFLFCMKSIAPLLHWLSLPVPAKSARYYFSALQRFFYGCNFLTECISQNLRVGTDNLLRVIATGKHDDGYGYDKITVAFKRFQCYLNAVDPEYKLTDEPIPIVDMVRQTRIDLETMVLHSQNLVHEDALLLRVAVKLLRYLNDQIRFNAYKEISDSTTAEVTRLLAFLLQSKFGVATPDSLSELEHSDIKDMSEAEWRDLCNEDTISLKEFCQAMTALVCQPFRRAHKQK